MTTTTKDVKKDLDRVEDTTVVGAMSLTPKQSMLDATDVESKRPGMRLRWVSLNDPQKIVSRQADGYKIVSNEDSGRRLGDSLVLMEIPRAQYEARVARQEKLNMQRLNQHKDEMRAIAEQVVAQLRAKGYDVNRARILIEEA